MTNRPAYHQSQIQMALKCLKQYNFRYVKGVKKRPSAALTIGTSVDYGNNMNLVQKITSKNDLPLSDVMDATSTKFDELAKDTSFDGECDASKSKDFAMKLIRAHQEKLAPKIQPIAVQKYFKLIHKDWEYDLAGTIDYIEINGVVVDLKTSKDYYALNCISRAIQPAMYDLAYQAIFKKKSASFRYDVLIKPTKLLPARVQQVSDRVTEDDRSWLLSTIENVHRALEAGIETPAPEGAWWCSQKWCAYYDECKGKRGRI